MALPVTQGDDAPPQLVVVGRGGADLGGFRVAVPDERQHGHHLVVGAYADHHPLPAEDLRGEAEEMGYCFLRRTRLGV